PPRWEPPCGSHPPRSTAVRPTGRRAARLRARHQSDRGPGVGHRHPSGARGPGHHMDRLVPMNARRGGGCLMNSLRRRDLLRIGMSTAGLALVNGCGPPSFAPKPRVARVAYLWTGAQLTANLAAGIHDGLREAGWIEGQNLVFDERTYGNDVLERMPV